MLRKIFFLPDHTLAVVFINLDFLVSCADEWYNFLERIGLIENIVFREVDNPKSERHAEVKLQLRLWASYRGQTLARTGTRW